MSSSRKTSKIVRMPATKFPKLQKQLRQAKVSGGKIVKGKRG